MRKLIIGLAVAAALAAGAALAVKPGETLYIKTKDAKVLDKADAKAKTVGTLNPGAAVKWNGADKKNKLFHEVVATTDKGELHGYTLQQNLSPNKPASEFATSDGKAIDAEAFKSSGAATKALSESALKYAKAESLLTLAQGVLSAESVAQKVDVAEAQAYVVKQTGGGK